MSILSLDSYQNLLQKCEYEYNSLQQCKSHPEYDFLLFNLVVGLNHLFEWFLKEKSTSEYAKSKCIETFNPARYIPIENFGLLIFLPGAVLQSIRLISIFQLSSQSTIW